MLIISFNNLHITDYIFLFQLKEIVSQNDLSSNLLSTAEENVEWCNQYLSPLERWFVALRSSSSSISTGVSLLIIAVVTRFIL